MNKPRILVVLAALVALGSVAASVAQDSGAPSTARTLGSSPAMPLWEWTYGDHH